jgi:hypothetical protein
MNTKYKLWFCTVLFTLFITPTQLKAITIEELARICETMESAIHDISLEYEWRVVPPWTQEETEAEMQIPMLEVKDGIRKIKLCASGFKIKPGEKRPFVEGPQKWFTEETSVISYRAESWNNLTLESFNGKLYKKLNIDDQPNESLDGIIAKDVNNYHPSFILSPIGFSILRTGLSRVTDRVPLSIMLKEKNLVKIQIGNKNVNGFSTMVIDFLQEYTKQTVMRVYFSVDHGYTPVRFEYINGEGTSNDTTLTIDVHSLEQVADGLWFPSSGTISSSDEERINIYQATGKIFANQGLKDENFDIEFPLGTKVYDAINDIEYTIKENS